MPELTFLLIAGTAVLVGAIVQSSVGLGLGLVAAPVVALLDPSLMPGTMLITTCVLPVLVLAADIIGRTIAPPGELEVGLVTSFVGAPMLLALIMRRRNL